MRLSSPLRLRRLLIASGYVLFAALFISILVSHSRASSDDWSRFDHRAFRVINVIAGDEIVIETNVEPMQVRLLGAVDPQIQSIQTRENVIARAMNEMVTISLEPVQTRDADGDLRAFVYLSAADCLNQDLIHDGLAFADRRGRFTYQSQFIMAENEARKKQRGMWKTMSEDQMPSWRREWLRSRFRSSTTMQVHK